jgi:peptidyl-prolyl cis-trans isomerase A (cyclophilin A)
MKLALGTVLLLAAYLAASPVLAEGPAKAPPAEKARAGNAVLLADPALLKAQAPESFKAKFETTKGSFTIEVTRAWSPNGADRFYNLVKNGFFDGVKFFRVVPNFVVQFGIHGDPALATKWLKSNIQDDPVKESNGRGYVTFAKSGAPNSRSSQIFINLQDNARLDAMGFSPFGRIVEGQEIVDALYGGYGESVTSLQGEIASKGNAFLEQKFPLLDAIKKATLAP